MMCVGSVVVVVVVVLISHEQLNKDWTQPVLRLYRIARLLSLFLAMGPDAKFLSRTYCCCC